ncbi:unnamed protein product [Paramecium pentaurelia]|uniref:t-SNARE coiled-coil homology domain-containing protein n=1 Tax=Paramecium pentaurelia TaxID=43138 RepID=A0A8S1U262_9CILI|nr:unnamed protein product [Paramecium pentaurelia]
MEDNTFNKLVEQVQSQLTELHDNIDQFDQDNKDVSNSSVGQDIVDLQDQIQNLFKQIQNNIQRLDNNTGHLTGRQQRMKQIKQFYKKEIEKFTQICKLLEQKLQEKRKTLATNQQGRWNDPKPKPIDELQEQLMHNQYDIENQVIRERQEDIQKIDHEAQMLNKLVGELALEVHKADEVLDLIDTNQQTTNKNLIKVNVELVEAQDSQKSANKKWLIIGLLTIILVGVLVTILVLKLK